jgi:hypothetical protein
MRKLMLGTVAALIASPAFALPVSASPCVTASVSTYTAAGFSCSVGGVTFSNISVIPTTSGGGTVSLTSFVPVTIGNEFGLELIYAATAGSGAVADVAWTYDVAGNLLNDVFLSLAGNTTGTGTQTVSEVLSNGVTLSLDSAGTATQTFSPIANLFVVKDQNNFGNGDGTANASILTNAFSLTTPLPGALPLFATGLLGFWGIRKRRGRQNSAAAA